ncbi:MAG: P-II family nitrogen regulator [Spirochaetes bacterium]|nr:MAG: P-II family nitrogen regulator [Spirochaetota bacterium]
MKKVEAIIRPEKLDDVLQALDGVGYTGITMTEVRGHGRQKGIVQQWRGEEYKVSMLSKMKIEIVAKDADAEKIKIAIITAARTGEIGDGKIFIYKIDEVVKIRTSESGDAAV